MTIDVNVNLSRWPFRRLPGDETAVLVEKLRSSGVTEAWAGSLDGLFHKDVASVNARLAAECKRDQSNLLRPFGTVNPLLPDWREDLRRCHEQQRMPGIRLHPNYHGYGLDEPALGELLTLAQRRELIVQLAVRMEDTRTQHPLMCVPDVDTAALPELVTARPKLRLVLLNAWRSLQGEAITRLADAGQVYFEISMLEGVGGIAKVLASVSLDRLLFGSHFPLFVLESAILKLRESELTARQITAITKENALRLLIRQHLSR